MLNKNSFVYSAIINLQQKECVVVGGGRVAERKLKGLIAAGAEVKLIAPECSKQVEELVQKYAFTYVQDVYKKDYVTKAFLVIAATDDKAVNRQICLDAPCLCNNIMEPHLGNFIIPAAFTKGDITVAVATGGVPAFSRLLKERLQVLVTPEVAGFNSFLMSVREQVKAIPSTSAARTNFWRQVLTTEIMEMVATGEVAMAKEKVLDAISSFRAQSQNSTGSSTGEV
ncbi:bifunctional precorrin-2 dehydrogenase/sirohydrochlorin ferrochelatase [Phascolarctobacterium sp.]|uniref:precorrin-2 dehydrogenase/sirohydrochlorin ferrochelatase family protein n=1 Tax=Phascolarctobacterium sp. TaxID=2049039 RepID=UPI003869F815